MEERCPNRECAVVIVEGIITKEGLWLYHKSVNREGAQILNSGDVGGKGKDPTSKSVHCKSRFPPWEAQ